MPADAPDAPGLVLGVGSSLSGRRWVWRDGAGRLAEGIAQRLEVPEIIGRVMAARGIALDDAADFLDPTLRALLPDPSLLIDMDIAAQRLAAAVRAGETIAVFGDYDVDGACSAALVTSYLRRLGCTVLVHVPDRITEGYGPNGPALRALVARGARLIICVDCGTAAAVALSAVAGEADLVVLDHHQSDGPPPPILATVNPNRLDDTSGLRTLCATAIAFMTIIATQRLLRRAGYFAAAEPDLRGLLDLVALATVCDVMPLAGLNRALVAQGLKVMARRERPGIAALLEVAQVTQIPSVGTCGFALGPRINAAGRIAQADMGLRLLLSEDPVEARQLATSLDEVNRERQRVEAEMSEQAYVAAAEQAGRGLPVLLVTGDGWHPGVVGIVAGRIKERHNRPTCVGALAEGMIKGSGRSVPGIDLGAAVIAAREAGLLKTGGGHAMAAGFSLEAGHLSGFHDFLNERLAAASALPAAADLAVEGSLSVSGATAALAQTIGRLAPFGAGNAEPTFVLPRIRPVRVDRVGREAATIRAFIEGEGGGPRLKALLFRAATGPLADAFCASPPPCLHLAGHLRAELYEGREQISFIVTDAALA